MHSSHSLFALAACLLLPCAIHAQTSAPTSTAPTSQYGWLEGTITSNDGHVISGQSFTNASMHIKGVRQGGGGFEADSDIQMGGLYTANNIRPGVYDLVLTKGYLGGTGTPCCPERIFGVVVKPGERTIYKIVMDQGDTYEEVGKPAVVSAPATNVTEELIKMQRQIDDLKQQVAALLKATAAPTPASSTLPAAKP